MPMETKPFWYEKQKLVKHPISCVLTTLYARETLKPTISFCRVIPLSFQKVGYDKPHIMRNDIPNLRKHRGSHSPFVHSSFVQRKIINEAGMSVSYYLTEI